MKKYLRDKICDSQAAIQEIEDGEGFTSEFLAAEKVRCETYRGILVEYEELVKEIKREWGF